MSRSPVIAAPGKWWDGLTEKQRIFVEARFANGGNGTAAAKEAKYKQPEQQAKENIRKPTIIAAMEKLRKTMTNSAIANREERQTFWAETLRDPNVSMKDRLRASELLGKSQADFVDRKIIGGDETSPLVIKHALDLRNMSPIQRKLLSQILDNGQKQARSDSSDGPGES